MLEEIFSEIRLERRRQDGKFGEQNHNPIEWIAILSEEVGEAAKEAVDYHFKYKVKSHNTGIMTPPAKIDQDERLSNYRKKLVQIAAVTIQMIECLDRNK